MMENRMRRRGQSVRGSHHISPRQELSYWLEPEVTGLWNRAFEEIGEEQESDLRNKGKW